MENAIWPPVNGWVMFYTKAPILLWSDIRDKAGLGAFIIMCKASTISLSWGIQNLLFFFFFYLHITDEILQPKSVGQHFHVCKCKVDGREMNRTHNPGGGLPLHFSAILTSYPLPAARMFSSPPPN